MKIQISKKMCSVGTIVKVFAGIACVILLNPGTLSAAVTGPFERTINLSDKKTDTSQFKHLTREMATLGSEIGKYFHSTEFREINDKLKIKYGIPSYYQYGYYDSDTSKNFKKYQAELQKYIPADIKLKAERLEVLGKQMGERFSSKPSRTDTKSKLK